MFIIHRFSSLVPLFLLFSAYCSGADYTDSKNEITAIFSLTVFSILSPHLRVSPSPHLFFAYCLLLFVLLLSSSLVPHFYCLPPSTLELITPIQKTRLQRCFSLLFSPFCLPISVSPHLPICSLPTAFRLLFSFYLRPSSLFFYCLLPTAFRLLFSFYLRPSFLLFRCLLMIGTEKPYPTRA